MPIELATEDKRDFTMTLEERLHNAGFLPATRNAVLQIVEGWLEHQATLAEAWGAPGSSSALRAAKNNTLRS